MNYIFDQTAYPVKSSNIFNATNKARADVTKIMESRGCVPFNVYVNGYKYKFQFIFRLFYVLWRYLKLYFLLKKGDRLYIQYPVGRRFLVFFRVLIEKIKQKGVTVKFLIHDLDYIRLPYYVSIKKEILAPLRLADLIVAHTDNMQNVLREAGIECPIRVLHLFDYLTTDKMSDENYCMNHRKEVIFAGNLVKSMFIKKVIDYPFHSVKFDFYGVKPDMQFAMHTNYIGMFKPENVSFIKGGWGLVWDGNSLDECSGMIGNYLKINASHKLSLYISAGIPVVVWNQCGLAQWIKDNKLGIAISSLKELDNLLESISEKEYSDIFYSVRSMSLKLRNGEMLANAFEI